MANHGPKYGLTSEVDMKRAQQYSQSDEADVTQWMEGILGEKLPGPDFHSSLKNGVLLCNLLNKLQPGCCKVPKKANAPFVQMENIGSYLSAVSKAFGMKEQDSFMTVDLYESKNMLAVLQHLIRLKVNVLGNAAISPRGRAAGSGSVFDREEQ